MGILEKELLIPVRGLGIAGGKKGGVRELEEPEVGTQDTS